MELVAATLAAMAARPAEAASAAVLLVVGMAGFAITLSEIRRRAERLERDPATVAPLGY